MYVNFYELFVLFRSAARGFGDNLIAKRFVFLGKLEFLNEIPSYDKVWI